MELSAFHITEAKYPQRDYPIALGIASLIIIFVYILGTLAIVIVVPRSDICLTSGIIQAFRIFFSILNVEWIVPLLILLLAIGSIISIHTWIIGPAKGLLIATKDGVLPQTFNRINKNGVPVSILILQGFIGSVLSLVFLYLNNTWSIWVLTALSMQFAALKYIMMFISILRLRTIRPKVKRPYKVKYLWLISIFGILSCLFGFFIVYIPPMQFSTDIKVVYRILLIISFIVLTIPPFLIPRLMQSKLKAIG